MTTPDNKKMALIYEGVTEPEVSEDPNIPSPLWRDTSGVTPVLKMHNADHSGWVPIASEFANKLEDDIALTFGTDDDATIEYNTDDESLNLESSNNIHIAAGLDGSAYMGTADTSVVRVNDGGGITISSFGGAVDIDGAAGVTIDAGTDANATMGVTGAGYAELYSDTSYFDVMNTGIIANTTDGNIQFQASSGTVDIDGAAGVSIDAAAGGVAIDNMKVVGTDDAGLFHVGAMPATGRAGQLVVDTGDSFKLKVCTVAGTPGTWVVVGAQS